ncbi:hypothetical protein V494_00546 [Pseudogymnoascus sp. VKM F-4513 (FW-928)]|nr:hypothetical protein V494_00546 [Pseudogymnoascus sp. VKM F-4513 (FW-928)]
MSLVLSSQTAANQINKTLWWAISEGDEDQVRTLLDQEGASLSARTPTKQTALNLAVADGHESIAKLLLEKGASIEAAGHNGEKPLYTAARLGNLQMVTLLLQFKPAIESFNVEKQQSALYISVGNEHEEVAKVLLRHGANVDLRNYGGETALFISAMKGNTNLMALLLQSGASKDIRSQDGRSVFDVAAGDNAMTSLLQTSFVVKGPLMSAERSERESRFTQIPTPPTMEKEADEVHASKGFEMTIVDFFLEKHEQRVVNKVSVWDALYGRGPEIIMARGRESMAWVEALVSRLSAEQNSGAAMLTDEFKSNLGLTNSAGQQYQTKTAQSSFMKPMCRFVKSDLETSFGTGARDHVMLFVQMSEIISEVQQGIDPTMSDNRPTWTRMARRYISIETLNAHGINYGMDYDPEYILIKRWVSENEQDSLWAHTRELRERRYERTTTTTVLQVERGGYKFEGKKAHRNIISKAKKRLKSAARFLRDEPSDSDREDGSDISTSGSDIDDPQILDESSPPHDEAHDQIKKIRFSSEQLAAAVQGFKKRLKNSAGKTEGLKDKGKGVATVEPVNSTKAGSGTEERSLVVRRMTELEETIDSTLNQGQKYDKNETFNADKPKVGRGTGASTLRIGAKSEGKIGGPPTHRKRINPAALDDTPRAQVGDNIYPPHLSTSVPSSGIPNITSTKKRDGAPQQINAPPATQRTANFLNKSLITGYLVPTDGKRQLRKSPRLQLRRTLDQYFYTHLNSTSSRDSDQVVYRYSQKSDTVISCCPQRWQSWPENEPMDSNPETPPVTLQDDPLNVHHAVLNHLKQPVREPITSAYDLAGIIADSCASVFDPFRITDEFQFLDFFERSISVVSDTEASCF